MDGVDIVIGAGTEIIAGEGMIVTAGGIHHVHFINPEEVQNNRISVRPYYPHWRWNRSCCGIKVIMKHLVNGSTPYLMLEAAEGLPINVGFTSKGKRPRQNPLQKQVRAGAIGLKVDQTGRKPLLLHHALGVQKSTISRLPFMKMLKMKADLSKRQWPL